jgi:hypothetical protein
MQYETTLKYNSDDFRQFYDRWIPNSSMKSSKFLRPHLITALITLSIACLIFLSNDLDIQINFLGLALLIVGLYHLFKLFVVSNKLKRVANQLRNEVNSYLAKHEGTETMGLKINEEEIQYFENGTHNSTFDWKDLTRVDFRDDHFMLFFGELPKDFTELPKTVLIPKFAVSDEFYNGVLELTKTKDMR